MLFTNFTQSQQGLTITLKNYTALLNVSSINFYQETITGTFLKKEFRWAFNDNYWSSWQLLNPGNFNNIINAIKPTVFFEIRYVLNSINSGKVTSFVINYAQDTTSADSTTSSTIPDKVTTINKSSLLNADLLGSKTPDYYLWRTYHKGKQSISTINGLQLILNNLTDGLQNSIFEASNVTGDGIGTLYTSTPHTLQFKIVKGNTGINITEDTDGIITFSLDNNIITPDPSKADIIYVNTYNSIQDTSISLISGVSIPYVDGSINAAIDAVDSSLVSYIDPQIAQLDASIVRIDASLGISILQFNDVSIYSVNWNLVGSFYEYDISNGNIIPASIVDVIPLKETITVAKALELLPEVEPSTGSAKIYATNAPTGDMSIKMNITIL